MLTLRGICVELRSHIENPLWWSLFDFLFSLSSLLLAFFSEQRWAMLFAVCRSTPMTFFEALWTDLRIGPNPGILDWYTILTGLLALAVLAVHGANFLILKTEGDLCNRVRRAASVAWWPLVILTALSLVASLYIRPQALGNFNLRPWGSLIRALVLGCLIALPSAVLVRSACILRIERIYYRHSCRGGLRALPILLPASTDPRFSITIENAKTGAYGLSVGLIWWLVDIGLAIGYFTYLYRFFRGKVRMTDEEY